MNFQNIIFVSSDSEEIKFIHQLFFKYISEIKIKNILIFQYQRNYKCEVIILFHKYPA